MNEKNLPDDIASKSLNELTDLADEIIKNLENRNNLENTSEDYANLLKINRLIEKKFQKNFKEISDKTIFKIKDIKSNKNAKSTGRKSGAKDSAERAAAEKKETFGQRFAKERKAAKKRGDELTHVFTYKGKKYSTRNEKEEATSSISQNTSNKKNR